jgi:hypothetical protein
MNFRGFVQFRRAFLEHTMDGRLSNLEALVLFCLILLADSKTGRGTINAAAIRAFLPDLSYEAAKRALKSLEDKQYIWRQITPHSKALYPYWVNRYEVSQGPRKSLQIDLSRVFESKDVSQLMYINPDLEVDRDELPDPSRHKVRQVAPGGALNNNKDNENNKNKEKDTTPFNGHSVKASIDSSLPSSMRHAASNSQSEAIGTGEMHSHEASQAASVPPLASLAIGTEPQAGPQMVVPTPTPEECGMFLKDGVYYDSASSQVIPRDEAVYKIFKLKGEWRKQRRYVAAERKEAA